jgi:hypothetical protein
MSRFAGLLGQPGAGRVGCDSEDVHAAGGMLDDEEGIQPAQGDRLEMEQVAGQDRIRLRLRLQELRPGWPGRRGTGSIPAVSRLCQTVEAPIR